MAGCTGSDYRLQNYVNPYKSSREGYKAIYTRVYSYFLLFRVCIRIMVDNVYKTPKTRMNTHFFLTTSVAQVCSRLKEVFVDKKCPRCGCIEGGEESNDKRC